MDPNSKQVEASNLIPKRTTPTWEMELLLSGATVFALFQGAQAMMAGGVYLLPRLQGELKLLAGILFTYGFGGVILLALTFALHLVIRAYWVALIGMNSVYPKGIRLDALSAGPLAKSLLAKRWQSMDDRIERADNASTVVFGLGVSMVLVLVPISLVVTLMFGLTGLASWIAGVEDQTTVMIMALLALLFLPYMAATAFDKRRGDKLVPGSFGYGLCHRLLSFYTRVGMSHSANPLATVFISNIGERRGQIIVTAVMLIALLTSAVGMSLSRQDLGIGSFGSFPDPIRGMSSSVEGRGYASSHEQDLPPATPYLPDMVSEGKYLRLVVPYVPNVHGHLMQGCDTTPASQKVVAERKRRAALLACLSRGLHVALDGTPVVTAPEWYTEPARDVRGLLYMIPANHLADGRHVISVLADPGDEPEDGDEPEQPYVLPFWR